MIRIQNLLTIVAVTCTANEAFAITDPPTFSNDVAKIVYEKCTVCHRPNSSGPFPLMTYSDVKRHSATIQAVLDDKYMPPWKPVDHGITFANARSMSEQETRAIKRWIEAGCPEGDREKTPAPPKFTDGWMLGKPDLVVKMNGTFQVPAEGPDIYRSFVFPLDLPEDKWVKAVELRPRAKTSVHHAIFFLDPAGNAREMDGADGQTGISGMGFLANFGEGGNGNRSPLRARQDPGFNARNPLARGLGGYVPGATPNKLPGDLAMPLPQGSDIVMQTHFHPSGKVETEHAELALYFAEQPSAKQLVPIMIPPMFGFGAQLKIPADDDNYRISDSITLPVDTQAIGVSGHAHYICREMKLEAKLPDGNTKVLLHIDDWDLDWQDQYQFAEPLDLPAGTVLHCEIVYDNSADNPKNPHHPPQDIRWGRGSTDEMGSVTLSAVAKHADESSKLQATVQQHLVETLVHRTNSEIVDMLMQLDDNHDGKLQRNEAPAQMNTRAFQLLDSNNDDGLDAKELSRVMMLRDRLRSRGSQ